MIPPRSDKRSWVRKIDGSMHVLGIDEQPQERWYPGNLSELLYLVTKELPKPPPLQPQAHACGSHWAPSGSAATNGQMIEFSTPVHENQSDQGAPRLNKPLYDVIPGCMSDAALDAFMGQDVQPFNPNVPPDKEKYYLFHAEAGMRIYELYAHMDSENDGKDERSLAWYIETHRATGQLTPTYVGPWALETMGGAGGQTIVGVASTATHGGDIGSSAIGDAIVAIHLIAPNGQEYWIEREKILPSWEREFPLVDENKLRALYAIKDQSKPGGAFREREVIIKKSDDLLDAAIVSCGRMGIIYSVVVRAIRQFALRETTASMPWKDVRAWLTDPTHPTNQNVFANHFVRVDVDVYPKPVFDWSTAAWLFGTGILGGLPLATVGLYAGIKGDDYRAWLITRQFLPLKDANQGSPARPFGRQERGGKDTAGVMPHIESQGQGTFRDPCASANWLKQFLLDMKNELTDIRNDAAVHWLAAGAAAAFFTITAPPLAAAARIYQGVLERVMLFCQAWIIFLSGIQEILPDEMHFGSFLSALLNTFADLHAHSIVQLLYWVGANTEHPTKPITAISYAVMDRHNYQNKGCVAPGDSIELFMDGKSPKLLDFIEYVLGQVQSLADDGDGFGGYISMRFMKESPSFLAMQRWQRTCSIEIAGLSEVEGCDTLMQRLEQESLLRGIILHWGQRNNRAQKDIEQVFSPAPGGPLHRWRDALSQLSEHGRLHNFSTRFTSWKGLEITEPRLYGLSASLDRGCEHETTTVRYDAFNNPPGTILSLRQRFFDGRSIGIALPPGLEGTVQIALGRGQSTLELEAHRSLNEFKYQSPTLTLGLRGFGVGDFWDWQPEAEIRHIDGVDRWHVEINLFSQSISNTLRASAVTLATPEGGEWVLRNPDLGADVLLSPSMPTAVLPSKPVFNRNWRFFSKAPASTFLFPPPKLYLRFIMEC